MTNLARLEMELAHKQYFDAYGEYTIFLLEEGLVPDESYDKEKDHIALLKTVVDILEALSNNIDYFRTIETEFSTNSQAYSSLKDRIDTINKKIALYEPAEVSQITNLFYS